MLTRRQFLSAATAGGATLSTFTRTPELRAAQYDVLIRGGRVVDPSRNFDKVADVGIDGGNIAAVQPDVAASSAAETIDATGKLVVPGLIDIHTHAGREKVDPGLCLKDGVTSLIAFKGLGALAVGAPADVAVLELREGRFEFDDNEHTKRTGP